MKCKIAMEKTPVCGKDLCCFYCPDKEECVDACHDNPKECPECVPMETELQVMQSAVPEAIRIITDINLQKKKLDEQEKLMRSKLLEAMETYGIKKFENEHIAFTYVAPTTKTTIDSTKLKKKYPDIAEECSKVSNVSASVRITVK
jgi:hypothetical protein